MQIIDRTLEEVKLLEARRFANLTLFPVLRSNHGAPTDYVTLDEALKAGHLRVSEVDVGGHVPELAVVNDGDRPVLLIDGEELVGAKQNRVLNLTILVPPHETIIIPVSCVEAGRWGYGLTRDFLSSPRVMYSKARAQKARDVSASMGRQGSRRSDQGAVWDEIAGFAAGLGVQSATSAMSDLFEGHAARIEDYVSHLAWVEGQTGAVFAIDGRILGLELLDRPRTARQLIPKLVRSYALDAIASRLASEEVPEKQAARDFVAEVAAAGREQHDALGLGQDVRIASPGLAGGALIHDGGVVHLSAFRLAESAHRNDGSGDSSCIQPPSLRRRRWRRAG
jgi:hypothetical protein